MLTIWLATICLIVVQVGVVAGLCLWLRHFVNQKQQEISESLSVTIHSWIDAQPDNKPSQLADMLSAIGAVVGSSAAQSIMASLAADKSHVARVANNLADEAQGSVNPLLGLLTGGRRGKGAAVARLAELLPAFLGKLAPGPAPTSRGNHQSFSL